MTGFRSGLATLLRNDCEDFVNIHCLCHRLELAFRDVVKKVKVYDKLMTLLIGLHYFYKKSHKNKTGLLNAFKALAIKGILPPKVTGTRWLPHLNNGLECLERSYAGFDAHLATASHTNAKAEGLLRILRDINVVTYALFLKEVIAPLMQLSKKLQRKDITLADSMVWIQTTAEMVDDLKARKLPKVDEVLETKAFSGVEFRGKIPIMAYKDTDIDNIVEAMQTRFQLDDITSPIVQATKVLNLSKWPMISNEKEKLADYGNEEIQFLAGKYNKRLLVVDPTFNEHDVLSQWQRVKLLAKRLFTDNQRTQPLTWEDVYDEECKNVFLIIDILLSLPRTSVSCETSFSQMKLVKTSRRVKLGQGTLDNLLQIKLVTPTISSYDPEESIDQWLTASIKPRGGRRMNYCRSKNVSMISDETVEHVEDEETSTAHTTTNEPEPGLMIDEDDEDEAEDDDIHLLNKYDTDSDYCSDFQAEEFNIERIMCFSKQYDLD
ncbi:zinc finger protein 862-like [Dreissena polymorpha]|nr:zinc finger protein 862-like [Dreissena polymorpha]